jgi:hypothetical protein
MLGLAWDDSDLASGEAHIAWQLHRIKGELRQRPTKTVSSEAPLPLPDICTRALAQRKVTKHALGLAAGEAWMGSGLVLTTKVRHTDRPSELPTLLPGQGGEGWRPRHPGARNPAKVRLAARRPGRPSAGGHDDPAAQQDHGDHGHLQPGVVGVDQGSAQAPRPRVRRGGSVTSTAVLCWSTGMAGALPVERKGPLTWVETRGIEPRTSCLQIADHQSFGAPQCSN